MSDPSPPDAPQPGWSRLLWPLVPVYAAGLVIKNAAYDHRWFAIRRLEAPVISVGNLSVGGAGKTPLVIRLAELLTARGFAVDVLSRGYGRRASTPEQVYLDAQQGAAALTDAERFGDEPLLIAKASGVPVYVGASRYAAGLLAEQRAPGPPRLHLLDDGFQHRQLARTVDIVVLHRSDFTAGLLPAGRLREPLSSLRRASIAVLRVEDAAFEPVLRRRFGSLPIWRMTREIALPSPTAQMLEPAVAFCGVAHPAEFFRSLTEAGVELSATHAFCDHHVYTDLDVSTILHSVRNSGARRLLTTEKDLFRLNAARRAALNQGAPLQAVPLLARLLDEEAAVTQMLPLVGIPPRSG